MPFKCHSQVRVEDIACEWAIESFSFCREKVGEYLVSPTFPYKAFDTHKWTLQLFPEGNFPINKDYLSILLRPHRSGKADVETKCVFSILNCNGEKTNEMEFRNGSTSKENLGCSRFILRKDLFDKSQVLLPNDRLTVSCNLVVTARSGSTAGESNPSQVPQCTLSDDFGRLFRELQLSDVVLSVGEKEHKAHKAILAARSPVFSAMFQHEMEENKTNRVAIADVDEEVLEEMLKYMYTGKVTKLEKGADKLLVAADKYALKRLKALCEKSLCDNLTVQKAAEALVFADLHSAEHLKEQLIIFINRHAAEITDTAGWEAMIISHPHLVTEILRASAKRH